MCSTENRPKISFFVYKSYFEGDVMNTKTNCRVPSTSASTLASREITGFQRRILRHGVCYTKWSSPLCSVDTMGWWKAEDWGSCLVAGFIVCFLNI